MPTKPDRDISKLHPRFKEKVELFLKQVGDSVFVTEGFRSIDRQKELYSKGRTTPGPQVTRVEHSNHQDGLAIDIAFKGNDLYPSRLSSWRKISKIAKMYGIDWGFDLWERDKPHFQDNGKILVGEIYNGIPIEFKDVCGKTANACYSNNHNTIYLQHNFFKKDEIARQGILFHEYCHALRYDLPRKYKVFWNLIYSFDSRIVKRINKHLKTNFIKNEFISKHAQKNLKEGFSECMEQNFLIMKGIDKTEYKGYLKLKLKVANVIFKRNSKYKLGDM